MTSNQQFFQNIVSFNAVSYEAIERVIGNLNKNIGLSAKLYEQACQIVGSTVSENYDLANIFSPFQNQINSDNGDILEQSLQNVYSGVGQTISYPIFNVCSHISTTMFDYNASISSSFLSGQIFYFSGAGTTSVISIPINSLNFSGNQFNSYLYDVPVDLAVYGIDNFSGNYSSSNLILFDYAWYNGTNLLIKLNFINNQTNKYLTFYWGTINQNSISTNYSIGSSNLIGTNNFINNLGSYTTSLVPVSINNFSNRKNFWSSQIPYNVSFTTQSFINNTPILWAHDRLSQTLIDGTVGYDNQPVYYNIINQPIIGFSSNISNFSYIYTNFNTSGLDGSTYPSANTNVLQLLNSKQPQKYNFINLSKQYLSDVPLGVIELQQNPKLVNLNSNGYGLINYKQNIPSAFIKNINDDFLWQYFSSNITQGKSYYVNLNKIITDNLNSLDNFMADYLFGLSNNNAGTFFIEPHLSISKNTLKEFTQPYGTNDTDPLNFSEYEELAIYEATNIVSSKDYLTFNKGQIFLTNDYNLPVNNTFEIFKPISLVCNGIDPYSQGNGLNFDYTLNLTFQYGNQSSLQKTLYLMASKFLISQSDYLNRVKYNQTVSGYYYLADPNSSDTSDYSVSSISEFFEYGYAGLIPDLKDGVIRPILTRGFTTNGGNSSTTVSSLSNSFVSLTSVALCVTEYALDSPEYWNPVMPKKISFLGGTNNLNIIGFTNLTSQIQNGFSISSLSGIGTFTILNVPVGSNCLVSGITINSLGSGISTGKFSQWIYPPIITDQFPCPSPAQLSYKINSNGILDSASMVVSQPGGANYYYDFDLLLTSSGFSTTIGTSYPSVHINLDNLARFTANVNNYILTSFVQTSTPARGYNQGFVLNNGCFSGLGYTSNAAVNVLINDYPTVDSFFIASSTLNPGDLEYYGDFQNPQPILSNLNYTAGTSFLTLYDNEIFNSFVSPNINNYKNINYITINSKIIEFNGLEPSGYIKINIYSANGNNKTLVASSNNIDTSNISSAGYTPLNVPIYYTLPASSPQANLWGAYYVSIVNQLKNCLLSIQGSYLGINTSNFSLNNTFNDPNNVVIPGGISTSAYDLDLGVLPINVGISTLLGTSFITIGTSLINVYLRKDPTYLSTTNQLYLGISTTYNSQTKYILSNPVSIGSLSTTFSGIAFTFSNIIGTSYVNSSQIIFSEPLSENNIYLSRSMSLYDVSQLGFGTTSQISVNSQIVNYDFVFNKTFSQVNNNIYGSFNFDPNFLPDNFASQNQLQFPGPNNLRVQNPTNIVDGFWSFSAQKINAPIWLYPRAWFNVANFQGVGTTAYSYIGYTHNIYVNVGYNSSNVYKQELITLNATPKWQTTWMSRTLSNYKNFEIFNVIQQTYIDSIYYHVGLGSTVIGIGTSPKTAIFEGTFNPVFGNLNQQVPITINIGTSSGVQMYINGSSQPIIDSFGVVSLGSTSLVGYLTTSVRNLPVNFQIYYYTLSTAAIEVYWSQQGINSSINSQSSGHVSNTPYVINNGNPVDELIFLNVSKTHADAVSANSGFPTGDSFVIRST